MRSLGLVAAVTSLAIAGPAAANVTVNVTQSGADVIATSNGTLDISDLTDDGDFLNEVGAWAQAGFVATGDPTNNVEGYFGFSGPDTFGNGDFTNATSGSGDGFGINGSGFGQPYVFVPVGYTSGSLLSGTALFAGTTIAALGLNTGIYTFTLPHDTVTVNIGAVAAVPEPATWAMLILGFGAIGATIRRRGAVRLPLNA